MKTNFPVYHIFNYISAAVLLIAIDAPIYPIATRVIYQRIGMVNSRAKPLHPCFPTWCRRHENRPAK